MDTSVNDSRVVETDRSLIEAELSRLLNEKKFAGAPQMSSFLNYIVTQTLDGKGDRIKAYTVGVDALGKPHTFDAQSDPSVRVLALRLRKTLAGMYESGDECHAQIVLRVGTYVPEFLRAEAVEAREAAPRSHAHASATHENSPQAEIVASSTAARLQAEPTFINAPRRHVVAASNEPARTEVSLLRMIGGQSARLVLRDPRNLLLMSALFIFFCIWLLSSDNNAVYMQKLSAGIPLPLAVSLEPATSDEVSPTLPTQTIPTLYLVDDDSQSERLRQVSILMGSSVVQSGSVNVVRVSSAKVPAASSPGDYRMVLNELVVDSHARVDAQILQLTSGVVVSSSTLLFDNKSSGFSSDEVRQVEGLGRRIADAAGSLYMNFCGVKENNNLPIGCTVDRAGDPTLVTLKSGAV